MRSDLLPLAGLIAFAAATLVPADNPAGHRCVDVAGQHFHLRSARVGPQELAQVRDAVRYAGDLLTESGVRFSRPPTIHLRGDRQSYAAIAGTGAFSSIGVSFRSDVYLLAPGAWDRGCWMQHDRIRDLLRHELLHVLTYQEISPHGGRIPSLPNWFNEGMAEFFSGAHESGKRPRLGQLQDRIVTLELDPFSEWSALVQQNHHFAYSLATEAVRLLVETHGSTLPRRIFERMGRGQKFEEAFVELVGEPVDAFTHRFSIRIYETLVCLDE